jgi:3-oxoacyl-[acyl-carrier protein] reductase
MTAFEGNVALITGAGIGIGYEIARQLALRSVKVMVNDVNPEAAEQAAEQIRAEGGICQTIAGDASDVGFIRTMVTQTVEHFGRLDAAVANAGITSWGSFFDYEPETFDKVLALNLRGSYFLAQAAARQMRDQGTGGRLLLMSSVTGHQAIHYLSCYAMTKAALEMLARNLVLELSPYGITVNAIAPGATVTPRNLADDPNYEAVWGQVTPMGRAGTTQDIAHAALFLLSSEAAQITGQTIVVDGGWSVYSPTPSLDFVYRQ